MLDILNGTIDLGKKATDLFASLKTKLKGDEAAAGKDLNEVLDELIKFYTATQKEISDFQSLDLANPGNLQETKRVLYDIQSGAMGIRIAEASGSCAKIKRIYEKHLDTWFQRVFKNETAKYREVRHLFSNLLDLDMNMVQATKDLEDYLSEKAQAVMKLVYNSDTNVITYHNKVSVELLETRKGLSHVVKQLVELKNDFAQSAGTI
jgi:hypothetical protein